MPELDALYYADLADAFAKEQNFQAAIDNYTQALSLNPLLINVYYNRGIAFSNLHDLQAAIRDYTWAIRLDPLFLEAYSNRATIFQNLGRYQAAIDDYSKAIELNPQEAIIYNNRATLYFLLEDYPLALADFTLTIALNPTNADAYQNRGVVYKKLGYYTDAIADFTVAIQIEPKQKIAYAALATTYQLQQAYGLAEANFVRFVFCITTTPNDPAAGVYTYGSSNPIEVVLNFFSKFADAPFVISRLIHQLPTILHLKSYQGYLLRIERQSRPVCDFLDYLKIQGLLKQQPRVYWHLYALIQYFMGDTAEAFRAFDEEIDQVYPLSPLSHYYYVKSAIFSALPQTSIAPLRLDAIKAAQQLMESKQQVDLVDLYYAGLILYQYGDDIDNAKSCFQRAKGLLPALYMLWFITPEDQKNSIEHEIRARETSLPTEKSFGKGITPRVLGRQYSEYWGAIQHYCFYQEISLSIEAIHANKDAFRISPFYEYWQYEATLAEQQALLFYRKARQTEQTLQAIDAMLTTMKHRIDHQILETSLKQSVTSIMREFEALQKDAAQQSGYELEFRLASHIYESALLKHYEVLHMAGFSFLETHLKLATYFFLLDKINTRATVNLLLYAIYTTNRFNPKLLDSAVKEGLIEATIDVIKGSESLKTISLLLAQGAGVAFATTWGNPLSVALVSFSVKALYVLMNEAVLKPDTNNTAGKDYEQFKNDLDNQLALAQQGGAISHELDRLLKP